MKKLPENDFSSDALDLTKSADVSEKFRSKQMLPWEVAIAVLYVATVVSFLLAVDIESYERIEFWIACGVFLIFGVALVVANLNVIHVKDENDKRRALLVSVLNGGKGCRIITDAKGRIIYSNRVFHDWAKDFFKNSVQDFKAILKDDASSIEKFQDFVEQAQKGRRVDIVLPYSLNNGERKGWMSLAAQPILDWTGYIHWRVDDVTVSHVHDDMLRTERTRLSGLMDNAPIGLFSVDERGCFIFTNKTLRSWLAAEEDDLLSGDYHLSHFLAEKPQSGKPYDILGETDENGVQRGEVKLVGLDGRIFVASVIHTIINDGEKGTFYTRSVIRDLTPEREWKRALKQSEDRFQRFFEEAPLGIALVDGEGCLTECNDAFAEMVKLPFQQMLGQSLVSLLTEDCRKKVSDAFACIKDDEKENVSIEVEFVNPDKDAIDNIMAQMFAGRFMGDAGIVLHFIDITAQKNLEKQFTQSQKMQAVGQLAGGVAHDFNNLLTAMIGFCDLLLMRHKAGDPSFGDIMQIKQNANRAANLVRQLLAFSRQQQLQPKVMDVTDVITEVSHLIRRLIGANIELKINHARDLGLVKIDVGQMEQVLINLAVNARDAMMESGGGGQLVVKTYNQETRRLRRVGTEELPAGQWVVIEVSDTGCGIPMEIIERIFDPFFSTKAVGAGTGLGLSTVYGIIKQTDGHIFVNSKVDKGTTFTMYLPRMSEDMVKVEEKKVVEESRQDLTGTSRIFLVEDEDAVRAFAARALSNKGYTVFEAASGELAVERLEKEKLEFDILVTDVIMPNMDGIQLSKIVKEKHPNVPIIFMSGYTEDRFRDEYDGEFHFLSKPFTLKQLAEKVKSVLEDN